MVSNLTTAFDRDGFALLQGVLTAIEVKELVAAISAANSASTRRRRGNVFAARDLLHACAEVRDLAESTKILDIARAILGQKAKPVRGLFFDKTSSTNWLVPWHQDVTIMLAEKIDVHGYGPWSIKAGIPHVQPPADILESMVAMRIHLDDCGLENGPLQVLPGSHRGGRLGDAGVACWRERISPTVCTAAAGDILLMRPLLVHASSPATKPDHRRVVHIEWSSADLPSPLQWHVDACRIS